MTADEKGLGRRALALMRPGPFRRYIIGSAISDTGTWMQVMAQGWVMSTLTDKAIMLGMVNFAAGLPTLALTMFGGSVADRFDKRKILIATQVVQITLALILGWLVLTNRIHVWHILILAALLGVSIAFEMPAISALVPELVKREEIAAAIALDRSVFHGSRLVGSSLAGLFVAWWGAASAFFVNAVSFIALIAALISLPQRTAGTVEEEEQRRSGIKEGFKYVASERIILSMICLIALTTVFVLGFLMAVSGTGSLAGSLGLLSVARENRLKFMTFNAVVVAVAIFCMSQSYGFFVTAIAMGFLAIALSMNFGLANTIVQERAPTALRGRVSAIFGMSFFGLMPIAGLLITGLSDLIGIRTALAVSSVIFGIGASAVLTIAGRHVCDRPVAPIPEPEAASVV
jgi:MFS family permease